MHLLAEIAVLGLAVTQAVNLTHHSRLFYPLKLWAEAAAERSGVPAFLARAYRCPYCWSFWVALGLAACYTLHVCRVIVLVLAVTRVAQLINDYTKEISHPPRYPEDADDQTLDPEDPPAPDPRRIGVQ